MDPDYRRLWEHSADAVFRWIFSSGLTYINPAFTRITGRSPVEAASQPELLREMVEPGSLSEFDRLIDRLRLGTSPSESLVTQLAGLDGKKSWVEFSLVPVPGGDGDVVGVDGIGRDVSEHLQVADQLSRRTLEQATLLQVQRELLAQLDLQSTLSKIVERAQRLLRAMTCTVFLVEADGEFLRPLASAGEYAGEMMTVRPRVGQGLTGWVVEHGVPQRIDRINEDPRSMHVPGTPEEDESLLSAPLEIGGRITGALTLSGRPDQFTENDLDFLVALAQVASLAIANSQTFDRVQRQATIDNLTGAFNRHYLTQNLRTELARAERLGYSVGLLMVDVDNLKTVNDNHGHLVGDELLRTVVGSLRRATRETDWVARYGGDEFAIVLPGCPPDRLMIVGEKLRQTVAEGRVPIPGGGSVGVTISLGGSVFPEIARSLEELLAQADDNERRAKQSTGNRVVVPSARPEPD